MVPDLIWASDFFGPQKIGAPRNLDPKKFGPRKVGPLEIWSLHEIAIIIMIFIRGPNFSGPKIFWGPKK